jgi:hypothetical protein
VASYLSNYLSSPRRVNTAGSQHFPVIRRFSPYTSQNYRATSGTPNSAPFAGQDLASALLQQRNISQASRPDSNFQDTYNYDPILTQIQALGSQSVANAQTNAAQIRNNSAINEGDPELLRSLGFDENTINAASNNPQSLFAQLNLDYQNRQRQLSDAMEAQNLYYSGEYQKGLSELATGKASGQSNLGQKLRDLLAGVDSGVLSAQETQRQADLQSQLNAQAQASTDAQNKAVSDLYQQLIDGLNAPAVTDTSAQAPIGMDPMSALVATTNNTNPWAQPAVVSGGQINSDLPSNQIISGIPDNAYVIGGPSQVAAPVPFGGTTSPTLSAYLAMNPLTLPTRRRLV